MHCKPVDVYRWSEETVCLAISSIEAAISPRRHDIYTRLHDVNEGWQYYLFTVHRTCYDGSFDVVIRLQAGRPRNFGSISGNL